MLRKKIKIESAIFMMVMNRTNVDCIDIPKRYEDHSSPEEMPSIYYSTSIECNHFPVRQAALRTSCCLLDARDI